MKFFQPVLTLFFELHNSNSKGLVHCRNCLHENEEPFKCNDQNRPRPPISKGQTKCKLSHLLILKHKNFPLVKVYNFCIIFMKVGENKYLMRSIFSLNFMRVGKKCEFFIWMTMLSDILNLWKFYRFSEIEWNSIQLCWGHHCLLWNRRLWRIWWITGAIFWERE